MKQDNRKPEETVLLNGIPYAGDVAASRKQKSRRWKWLTAVSVLGIAMQLPVSAHAGIFDVFSEIFGTIQSDIGSSLKSINQLTQQVQQLYQTTMWPLAALNQARGFVRIRFELSHQMNQIFSIPQRAQSQRVRSSSNRSCIAASRRRFRRLARVSRPTTAQFHSRTAPRPRTPNDGHGRRTGPGEPETTLIADQGADTILQTANQMENQVATATPGSNPYLTAQAQVSNLRCQAYLQKMLAAQLRQEAGRIAHDNALLKRRTTITGGINSLITGRSRALKGECHVRLKEVHKQSAQAICVAAQARTNLRDSGIRRGLRTSAIRAFLAQAGAAQAAPSSWQFLRFCQCERMAVRH